MIAVALMGGRFCCRHGAELRSVASTVLCNTIRLQGVSPLNPFGTNARRNAKTPLTAGDSHQKCLAKSISNEILLISSMPHGAHLADWIAVRGLADLDQISVNLVIEVQLFVQFFHNTAECDQTAFM